MKLKNILMILTAGLWIGFSGCTTHRGLHIKYPEFNEVVADLIPTLAWEVVSDTNVTYDLAVFESEEINPIVYEEGLKEASYQIKKELKPGTMYRWTVRHRKGEELSEWTKQETQVFTGISYHRRAKYMRFLTPKKTE